MELTMENGKKVSQAICGGFAYLGLASIGVCNSIRIDDERFVEFSLLVALCAWLTRIGKKQEMSLNSLMIIEALLTVIVGGLFGYAYQHPAILKESFFSIPLIGACWCYVRMVMYPQRFTISTLFA